MKGKVEFKVDSTEGGTEVHVDTCLMDVAPRDLGIKVSIVKMLMQTLEMGDFGLFCVGRAIANNQWPDEEEYVVDPLWDAAEIEFATSVFREDKESN